jgi:hypothetical protein
VDADPEAALAAMNLIGKRCVVDFLYNSPKNVREAYLFLQDSILLCRLPPSLLLFLWAKDFDFFECSQTDFFASLHEFQG